MQKIHHHLLLCLLFFTVAFTVAACEVRETKAGPANETAAKPEISVEAKTENNPAAEENTPQLNPASLVGTYKFKTYKDGKEGYDNTLEIEQSKGGKLRVYLTGVYIYQANGAETMKEGSGEGFGTLRGSTLTANVSEESVEEEEAAACRVTITFRGAQATVKQAANCSFNVMLDGVYTKETPQKPIQSKTAKLREIKFDELYDFVNEYDKNKTGERFVITDVPADRIADIQRADSMGNQSYKGYFYLVAPENDSSAGFITTPPLLRELQANNDKQPTTLRMTAVLVQSDGKFDVYRLSFVTKIEGLDENGDLLWTASGEEPAKIKFRH